MAAIEQSAKAGPVRAIVFDVLATKVEPHFDDDSILVEATLFQRKVGVYVGLASKVYLLRINPAELRVGYELRDASVLDGTLNIFLYPSPTPTQSRAPVQYYGVVCSSKIEAVKFNHMRTEAGTSPRGMLITLQPQKAVLWSDFNGHMTIYSHTLAFS